MDIVRIVKPPCFVICCLLLIICWLLSHHLSCDPYMSTTIRGTQFSHIQDESSSDLSSLLKGVATDGRTVIITMVDREWAKPESLLDLFLESFRIGEGTKHLLNHLIVVALDDQALRYCLRAHPNCYLHRDCRRKFESLSPDGLVAGWRKKALVKEILELGYNMMFTEADVMWLRNPLMYCHPHNLVSAACGFSSSDQHQHATAENTGGFFYVQSDDTTIYMFKLLNLERVVYPSTGNQSFCDILKRDDLIHDLGMKVTYLDDVNFWRFCQPNPQNQSKIATVHASCCNDTKSKVHYLKLFLQDRKNMTLRWRIPSQCKDPCIDSEGEEEREIVETIPNFSIGLKAQDASYVFPKLLDELEVEIFARVPCFEYWKLQFLNKRFLQLLKSCEIFKVRQERKLVKPHVFLHSGGKTRWKMFDKDFESFRELPQVPSDNCFFHSDKETISAGTQLIVIGKEADDIVVWRYELERHKWFKGPAMITPRVMYGSASHRTNAYFAGGIHMDEKGNPEVLKTSEKYNAESKIWTAIHGMHKRRQFSSGCFLCGKFYVLGGRDENNEYLTCGERYDEVKNSWELIPNILGDMSFTSCQSSPLIAVVNDNPYSLDISSNELRVYDINANAWKKLGVVPVRSNAAFGWGVAFKSIGDRLLVIGPSPWNRRVVLYTCRPSPDKEEQLWEELRHYCDAVQKSVNMITK